MGNILFPVDILEHSIDLYHKQQEILDGEGQETCAVRIPSARKNGSSELITKFMTNGA